jgi:membrane dipeptidase
MVARYADRLAFARTADDVEAAWASGRIASLLGAEGGHSINNSLATLRMLHVLGVRYLTLTHNSNVDWADSATDVPVHDGLSAFGVEVVREMNRIGMLVDLSHVSADTMRDALRVAEVPAIFSHSSARAVCDSPRNAPDDVLESLRDNGGVCMVTFVPTFVSPQAAAWRQELNDVAAGQGITPADAAYMEFYDTYAAAHPTPKATLGDVVRHVQHVREVAGIDHVGLGGDYDGVATLPEGLEDVTGYPRLLAALADLGWSDDDLGKLTSGNILRVLRDAEAGARSLQEQRGPSLATIAELDGAQAG